MENDVKNEIMQNVNDNVQALLDDHYRRMNDWESKVVTNMQNNINTLVRGILEEFTPKPAPLWQQLVSATVHGIAIGLPIALMLYLVK